MSLGEDITIPTQCTFNVSRTPKRNSPGQLGSWTQDQRDSMGSQMPTRGLSESPGSHPGKEVNCKKSWSWDRAEARREQKA